MALKHVKNLFSYQPPFPSFLLHLQLNIVYRNVSICFIARLDDCLREICDFIDFCGIGMDSPSLFEISWERLRLFLLTLTILASIVQPLISGLHRNESLMYKHSAIIKDPDLIQPWIVRGPTMALTDKFMVSSFPSQWRFLCPWVLRQT